MNPKKIIKFILPHGIVNTYRQKRKGKIRKKGVGTQSAISPLERRGLLAALVSLKKSKPQKDYLRYLEIGVLAGGTIAFLKNNINKVKFEGIDLFEDYKETISDKNTHVSGTYKLKDVQKALGDEVKLQKGKSKEILPELEKSGETYDMIFIDANHTYEATYRDYRLSLPLLNEGGYLAFHNCSVGINPDFKYIKQDGGPWLVTQKLRKEDYLELEIEVERLRVFRYTTP